MDPILEETLALNKTTLEALRACIMTEDMDRVKAHGLFSELERLHNRVKYVAIRGAA